MFFWKLQGTLHNIKGSLRAYVEHFKIVFFGMLSPSNRFRQIHEHIETGLTSDGHSIDDHSRELLQFEATVMHSYRPKQLLQQHKTHHQTDGSGAHEDSE